MGPMIAPEGFTEKPFNRKEYAAMLRKEMAEYGAQRARDAAFFWFPAGVLVGGAFNFILWHFFGYK